MGGSKLEPPAVEYEIEEVFLAVLPEYGYGPVVPRPCVIQVSPVEHYPVHVERQAFLLCYPADVGPGLVYIPGHNHQGLVLQNIPGDLYIALENLVKAVPFRVTVRPRQLHPALLLPLCGKSASYIFCHQSYPVIYLLL